MVEHLSIGDTIVTSSGAHRLIRWLGSRTIDCLSHPDPRAVWPIRIAAHAFGDNRPVRDLFVSPDHAICVDCMDKVLIPASRLLNGSTVARHPVDTVTYWHVELDSHDLLLADGLKAESYLDVGNRSFFTQNDTIRLHAAPDLSTRSHTDFCRPFVDTGPILHAIRCRLVARAARLGWRDDHEADIRLLVDGHRVEGLRAGDAAVFLLSGRATDVRLVSDTFVPDDINGWGDRRRLGIAIRSLSLLGADGEHRRVALDDARLAEGFFAAELHDGLPRRWTTGDAFLNPTIWDGMTAPIAMYVVVDRSNVRATHDPSTAGAEMHDMRR